jgi:hypothetical protein
MVCLRYISVNTLHIDDDDDDDDDNNNNNNNEGARPALFMALGRLCLDFHATHVYQHYAANHMRSFSYKEQVGSAAVCKHDEAAN